MVRSPDRASSRRWSRVQRALASAAVLMVAVVIGVLVWRPVERFLEDALILEPRFPIIEEGKVFVEVTVDRKPWKLRSD